MPKLGLLEQQHYFVARKQVDSADMVVDGDIDPGVEDEATHVACGNEELARTCGVRGGREVTKGGT